MIRDITSKQEMKIHLPPHKQEHKSNPQKIGECCSQKPDILERTDKSRSFWEKSITEDVKLKRGTSRADRAAAHSVPSIATDPRSALQKPFKLHLSDRGLS